MDTEKLQALFSKREKAITAIDELDAAITEHAEELAEVVAARDASDRETLPRVRAFRAQVEAYDVPRSAYAQLHVSNASVNTAPTRIETAIVDLVAALTDAERGLEIRLGGQPDEEGDRLIEKRARLAAELAAINRELVSARDSTRELMQALAAVEGE